MQVATKFHVGQNVYFSGIRFDNQEKYILLVEKVLKNGEVRTNLNMRFDKDGNGIGLIGTISPLTQELTEEIGHWNVSRRLEQFNFSKLSLHQLRLIVKCMSENGMG